MPNSMRVFAVVAIVLCLAIQIFAAWRRRGRPWVFQVLEGSLSLITICGMLWVMYWVVW